MKRPAQDPEGGDAQGLLLEAIEREGEAQRLLMAGDESAAEEFAEVSRLYRRSWERAHRRAYGRLIGMLKAAVLAGAGPSAAEYALAELDRDADSPASAYAVALAALIEGDDSLALRMSARMEQGSAAFARTALAIAALARRDVERYAAALRSILADFESRDAHLTGVAIADTALVLERLATPRGLAVSLVSPLLPPRGDGG